MEIICVGIRKLISDSITNVEHHFEDDENRIIRELDENREQHILELEKNREQHGECKQCGGKFLTPNYNGTLCPECLNFNYFFNFFSFS